MQQIEIVGLQTFVTVVEAGSFSRAAEKFGSTTAAASRRLAALEEWLRLYGHSRGRQLWPVIPGSIPVAHGFSV